MCCIVRTAAGDIILWHLRFAHFPFLGTMATSATTASEGLQVPTTAEGYTPEWVSKALGIPISPQNFELTGNVQEGTGFLSSIFRISCHTEPKDDEKSRQLNLIVKTLPAGESEFEKMNRQLSVDQNFDIIEINFYKYVLPDIIKELPELESYLCKFYTGFISQQPRNSVIILEDLKAQCYYSVNFLTGELNQPQIEQGVKFIAKFHYAGNAVLHKKEAKTPNEMYPFLAGMKGEFSLRNYFLEGYSTLDEFFASQNRSPEFRRYFAQLGTDPSEIVDSIFAELYKPKSLLHGDPWVNNVLLNDNPDLPSVKFIDWQLVTAGDPVWDIALTIVTFLPASKLNKENVVSLFKLYFDTYVDYCRRNELDVLITREYEEFLRDFLTYGMSLIYMWFSMARDRFVNNLPRYLGIYEFLYKEVDIVPFLLSVKKGKQSHFQQFGTKS